MYDLSKKVVAVIEDHFTALQNTESGIVILSNLEAAFLQLAHAKRSLGLTFSQSYHEVARARVRENANASTSEVWLLDTFRSLVDCTSELLYSTERNDQIGAVRLLMKIVQHEASVRVQKDTLQCRGPSTTSSAMFPQRLFDSIVICILHAAGRSRPTDTATATDAATQMIDARLECLVEYASLFVDIRLALFKNLIKITTKPLSYLDNTHAESGPPSQRTPTTASKNTGGTTDFTKNDKSRKRFQSVEYRNSSGSNVVAGDSTHYPKRNAYGRRVELADTTETRWVVNEFFTGGMIDYYSWKLCGSRLSTVVFYILSRLPLQKHHLSKARGAAACQQLPASDSDTEDSTFSILGETSDGKCDASQSDSITAAIYSMEDDNLLDSDDELETVTSAEKGGEEDTVCSPVVKMFCEGCSSKSKHPAVHRRAFQLAWRRYLDLADYYTYVRRMTLQYLPRNVLPYLPDPMAVASFFTLTFNDHNIADSVLAVSGLFYLLLKSKLADTDAKFNLADEEEVNNSEEVSTDMPTVSLTETNSTNSTSNTGTGVANEATGSAVRHELYSRLYTLLQPALFTLACRARFLRLLSVALQSSYLSSCTAACFIKKCLRTAALVNAPSAVWLVALAHGLLLRHNISCQSLIHYTPPKQPTTHSLHKHTYCPDTDAGSSDIWVDSDTDEIEASGCRTVDAVIQQQPQVHLKTTTYKSTPTTPVANDRATSTCVESSSAIRSLPNRAYGDTFDFTSLSMMSTISRRDDELSKWSLWELELLKRHSSPDVAGLTDIFYSAGQKGDKGGKDYLDPNTLVTLSKGDLVRRTWAACVRQLVDTGVEPAYSALPVSVPADAQRMLCAVLM